MVQTDESRKELLNALESYTSNGSGFQKHISEKFRDEYKSGEALRWYSKESFLYQVVNNALRQQQKISSNDRQQKNVEFLYGIRHFLIDLHKQLQDSHGRNVDFKKPLYRGLKLGEDEATAL